MHLIDPIRRCIEDIIRTTGPGMKAMVFDDFTTGLLNVVFPRSELLLREVYMLENIRTICGSSERLNHLKCIVVLRPTKENIELLCREISSPHYRTYYLYFSGRINHIHVDSLAKADETEVVRGIKELPLDYSVVTPFLFHLKLDKSTFGLRNNGWLPEGLKRCSDGLSSLLISLKMNPIIRYQAQSQICKSLAEKVGSMIKNEALANMNWRKAAPFDVNGLLLILDRRCDLIAPIIHNWTYLAMIHEEYPIVNNCIDISEAPTRSANDPKRMMISIDRDPFFRQHYYQSYGDLGPTLLQAVSELKVHNKSQHKVETMADMRRFIDEYPETKRYASDLRNHVFLMSELGRIVSDYKLMSVSQCEQELVCDIGSRSDIFKKLEQIIPDTKVRPLDAVRLVSLYLLTYPEKSPEFAKLLKLLRKRSDVESKDVEFVSHLRDFNASSPQNDQLDVKVQKAAKKLVQDLRGVDNVLAHYRPKLHTIISDLKRGNKLEESEFAFSGERQLEQPIQKLAVFVVGGVTYDEALIVDQFNRTSGPHFRIIIGGSCMLNFRSLIDEVEHAIEARSELQ